MSPIRVYLFGRFAIEYAGQIQIELEGQKARELFCYLLLHRERPHLREKLTCLLWPDSDGSQTKQYLRRTLWQLQSTLEEAQDPAAQLIALEGDWVQLNPAAGCWTDADQLEDAYTQVADVPGRYLDPDQAALLRQAVALYRGDLLEDWYQDWCVLKREQLQNLYLTLLDKLMGYCEAYGEYEKGAGYGMQILHLEIASERTYRRLMRLRYLAGDRTGALREYQRCVDALQREFGVTPARSTIQIHEQILNDQPLALVSPPSHENGSSESTDSLDAIVERLNRVRSTLLQVQEQIEEDIKVVKNLS